MGQITPKAGAARQTTMLTSLLWFSSRLNRDRQAPKFTWGAAPRPAKCRCPDQLEGIGRAELPACKCMTSFSVFWLAGASDLLLTEPPHAGHLLTATVHVQWDQLMVRGIGCRNERFITANPDPGAPRKTGHFD